MGRYLRGLIAGREHELLGLCADGEADAGLLLAASGMKPWPLWEQVSLPRAIAANRIDTFIAPYNTAPFRVPTPTRLVLIVHDLIYFEPLPPSQSRYQNAGRMYRRVVVPHAIRRADLIVANSRFTAEQLDARFGVPAAKVRVIPACVEERWFENARKAASPHGPILAVSGEAPSKNLARAIEAFARYRHTANARCMKVAGVKPAFHAHFRQQAQRLGVADAVEFLPYLSDAQMLALFREASLLFMPSLSEGFGIPVLEAMASGVPVVCSRTGSLPEVGGSAAEYFDPQSVAQMSAALAHVTQNDFLRASMRDAGLKQAQQYHPRKVRSEVEELWAEINGRAASPTFQSMTAC